MIFIICVKEIYLIFFIQMKLFFLLLLHTMLVKNMRLTILFLHLTVIKRLKLILFLNKNIKPNKPFKDNFHLFLSSYII